MATNVQNVKNTGFYANLWIFMIKIKVCMYLDIISRPVSEPLGCYLVPFFGLSQRLSVELDPLLHSDRGVVNHQFLSLYQSDMVLLLCRASQEHIIKVYCDSYFITLTGACDF